MIIFGLSSRLQHFFLSSFSETSLSIPQSSTHFSMILMLVLKRSQSLFSVSSLKYSTILEILIFPPDISEICFTILMHKVSMS